MHAIDVAPFMFLGLIVFLLIGYPVAFSLAAVGIAFALFGFATGLLDPSYLHAIPLLLYGRVLSNELLLAIPFFTFMGAILERSRLAEDMLDGFGQFQRELPRFGGGDGHGPPYPRVDVAALGRRPASAPHEVRDRHSAESVDQRDSRRPPGLRAANLARGSSDEIEQGGDLEHTLDRGGDHDQPTCARLEVVPLLRPHTAGS